MRHCRYFTFCGLGNVVHNPLKLGNVVITVEEDRVVGVHKHLKEQLAAGHLAHH